MVDPTAGSQPCSQLATEECARQSRGVLQFSVENREGARDVGMAENANLIAAPRWRSCLYSFGRTGRLLERNGRRALANAGADAQCHPHEKRRHAALPVEPLTLSRTLAKCGMRIAVQSHMTWHKSGPYGGGSCGNVAFWRPRSTTKGRRQSAETPVAASSPTRRSAACRYRAPGSIGPDRECAGDETIPHFRQGPVPRDACAGARELAGRVWPLADDRRSAANV